MIVAGLIVSDMVSVEMRQLSSTFTKPSTVSSSHHDNDNIESIRVLIYYQTIFGSVYISTPVN